MVIVIIVIIITYYYRQIKIRKYEQDDNVYRFKCKARLIIVRNLIGVRDNLEQKTNYSDRRD